jgi:flagellar basal-body rod protein FlgG
MVQIRRLEVASQNLANLNTSGYKGERLAFSEILAGSSTTGQQKERMGGMVAVDVHRIDFSQGKLQPTGNPLDLAVSGEGFFAIDTPRGVRYTRQGTFTLSSNGTVITPLGDPLLGAAGPIRVEGEEIKVTPEGAVLLDGAEVDRIRVVRFANPLRLTREGQSLFRAPESEAEAASAPSTELRTGFQVLQGSLEESNVNPIEAMVTLISIQRNFEAYERAMRTMDSATQKMITDGARA